MPEVNGLGYSRAMKRLSLSLLFAFLAFTPGCGTIGSTPDASVASAPTKGPVGQTIEENNSKFVHCARDSVTVQTETIQKLTLDFTIDGQGFVKEADIAQMTAPDPDLRGCILYTLKKIRFPAPKDGKSKKIQYPLTLRPQ